MSQAGYSSTSLDSQRTGDVVYTTEGYGLLQDAKEISVSAGDIKTDEGSTSPRECGSYLVGVYAFILEQLQHSEEERHSLEKKVEELRDECNAKTRRLNESLKELNLANSELDSMTSKWQSSQREASRYVSKMEDEKQSKEIDEEKRVKQLSHNLQELQHKNVDLQKLVELQGSILKLNDTPLALSSSKGPPIKHEDSIHSNGSLSEEPACQDDKYISTKDVIIFIREGLEDYKTGIAAVGRKVWELLSKIFVILPEKHVVWPYGRCFGVILVVCFTALQICGNWKTGGDEARVNAWRTFE
ncbi:hypothetical protein PSHT_13320 [Puccinia striiformis]|uniref:Uncharacterized protein n=1 Tax=Puccinia striiformis TaxID=27350 RepID=A0A2S4US48_9BASI|nr:hypothetical protein PSHT_13320 [Puccinia striiformis]